MIAEVNNTYGGNLRYVLGPRDRIAGTHATFRHVRELFVSPFLHGDATYDFTFDAPLDGDRSTIRMHVYAGTRTALGDVASPRGSPARARRSPIARSRSPRCAIRS